MPRNGSGVYTLLQAPFVNGTTADATAVNSDLSDIASALSFSIAKDGQTPPTANLPMGNFKLTGLLAGTVAGDSLAYGQGLPATTFSGDVSAPNFVIGTQTATTSGAVGFDNVNGPSVQFYGNSSSGAGGLHFVTSSTYLQAQVSNTSGAVNYWNLTGAATGSAPTLSVAGTDTNVNAFYSTQGTGSHEFLTGGGVQVVIANTPSVNRFITLTGSAGGNPTISTSLGELQVGTPIRETSGGSHVGDVASTYSFLTFNSLRFIDSTRTANNREADFLWSGGALTGRFVNDADSSITNWLTVAGGQASGVSSITLNGPTVLSGGVVGDTTGVGIAICRTKAATTSRTSTTTLASDPDLVVPLVVGTYAIDSFIPVWGATTGTQGIKTALQFSGTASSAAVLRVGVINGSFAAAPTIGIGSAFGDATVAIDTGVTPNADWLQWKGTITITAPGNLSFQWSQNSSSANSTNVGVGAYLSCTKVA